MKKKSFLNPNNKKAPKNFGAFTGLVLSASISIDEQIDG